VVRNPIVLATVQIQCIDPEKRIVALQPSLVERPDPCIQTYG